MLRVKVYVEDAKGRGGVFKYKAVVPSIKELTKLLERKFG